MSGDAIREIAKMQMEIDKYHKAIQNICLLFFHPSNICIKSDIYEIELIYGQISDIQKENKELKDKLINSKSASD
ncbi:MAG: hypothetical protein RR854_00065 [Muribaculaceae bacterium]